MVRRVYKLYPQVFAFHNLVAAESTAARGKRRRPDVARFDYHLEGQLLRLRDDTDSASVVVVRGGPHPHPPRPCGPQPLRSALALLLAPGRRGSQTSAMAGWRYDEV